MCPISHLSCIFFCIWALCLLPVLQEIWFICFLACPFFVIFCFPNSRLGGWTDLSRLSLKISQHICPPWQTPTGVLTVPWAKILLAAEIFTSEIKGVYFATIILSENLKWGVGGRLCIGIHVWLCLFVIFKVILLFVVLITPTHYTC